MSKERERLVEELNKLRGATTFSGSCETIADFIIADRRRIVEPLVKAHKGEFTFKELFEASVEVLKNAELG